MGDINNNEIKTAYEASLTWLSDGDIALAELLLIVLQMHKDFLDFKKKHPEDARIPLQRARFAVLHRHIHTLQGSLMSEKTFRTEMASLRSTVGFQLELIAQQDAEIVNLKEQIKRQQEFDGTNG